MFCNRRGLFRWEQIGWDAADRVDGISHSVGERVFDCDGQLEPDRVSELRLKHGDADSGGDRAAVGSRNFGDGTSACERRRLSIYRHVDANVRLYRHLTVTVRFDDDADYAEDNGRDRQDV